MVLNKRTHTPTVEEYAEPVYYCKQCHSLAILTYPGMSDDSWDGGFCSKCGSTDIGEEPIGTWLEEEKALQGKDER